MCVHIFQLAKPLTVSNLIADYPYACRLTYITHTYTAPPPPPPHLDPGGDGDIPKWKPLPFPPSLAWTACLPRDCPIIKALPQVGPQYPHVERVVHTATIHSVLHQTMHEVPLWWACNTDTSEPYTNICFHGNNPSCPHCLILNTFCSETHWRLILLGTSRGDNPPICTSSSVKVGKFLKL